ncbi:AMP-binding protein [Pseudorhodoferax sp.]|uniref:AMP-binding protein n=1 Tax=Pseudorhodoferax sp. TaxID=1993553 RepID=UPI002DD6B0C5|nr:AMP-binding protein [Pseudorhodoferax sp.]
MARVVLGERTLDADMQADRGARLAGGLRRLGLREGDVLAVLMRNDLPYIDVVHACRIAGIAYCPINWHFTADEVAFIVEDSGAKALLGHGDLLDEVAHRFDRTLHLLAVGPTGCARASHYESWLVASPRYDGPTVSPRGHMAYTSGTTGRPKGVVRHPVPLDELPARQLLSRQLLEQTFGLHAGCRALLPAPLYHSAPSGFLQGALAAAERLVVMERFDAEAVLAAIAEHRIDTVYLVPIMYVRLLRLPQEVRRRHDLSSLRYIASTGAPCAPEVKRAMIEWLGPIVHETYASSEAGMVTSISAKEALARPGSAGRPVLGAQVRILDAQGVSCAPHEIGLIYVRQPVYSDFTYRHNDAARRAVERDGLIHLGDMGYLDADGYLFVCDRASDMVISGGVNIYPAEIENRLMAYAGVADCAVFGVPDAEYGERLHAVVEPARGVTLQADILRSWMQAGLSGYKVPREIEFAELPRDDNGKIAKRRLRARHWEGHARRV